jgi:uncharacterized protein (DUF983 family)
VICPHCGNKPISFARFMVTVNPWRLHCVNCGADLRAGPTAYTWTVLHLLLALALVSVYKRLTVDGVIASTTGLFVFLAATVALVFLTAYVIPWMFLTDLYRVNE